MNNSSVLFFKKNWVTLVLFFLLSLLPFLWLEQGQLILGYDAVYPLHPVLFLYDRIFSWTATQNFGYDQSGIQGSLFIHFVDSLPQIFFLPAQLSQKIVYSMWFFLLLLSPFIFMVRLERYNIVKSPIAKYIFPVLYAFNFYILEAWWIAERTKFSLVIVTPLILSLLLPLAVVEKSKKSVIKDALLSALLLFFFNGGGWGGLPLYGGLIVGLVCFYIFFLIYFLLKKQTGKIFLLTLFFIVFGGIFLLLDAYTLLPFLFVTLKDYGNHLADAGGISGLTNWAEYLSRDTSFLNLLRLQGIPEWYNTGPYHPYASFYLKSPVLIFFSFLFPAALFSSFFVLHKQKNPVFLYFQILLICSLFLTAGAHAPFGFLFEFFMRVIPGFAIFRSAIFKFGYLYWFVSGIFISITISGLIDYLSEKYSPYIQKKRIRAILGVIVVSALLFYHFPYFTGSIFHISGDSFQSRVSVPGYVLQFAQWWREQGRGEKILLLPQLNQVSQFEAFNWNYLSLFPILGNIPSTGTVENLNILASNERDLVTKFYDAISMNDFAQQNILATQLGIRYFLLRRDFAYKSQGNETEDPAAIKKALMQNPEIELVKTFGKWDIYRFKAIKPQFYISQTAALFSGNTPVDTHDSLFFQGDSSQVNQSTITSRTIYPSCLSCGTGNINTIVKFPDPVILPGTILYKILQVKDIFMHAHTQKSYDNLLFGLIGNTINEAGQLHQLLTFKYNEEGISVVLDHYLSDLGQITSLMSHVKQSSANPYTTSVTISQYMQSEIGYIQGMIQQRQDNAPLQIQLETILFKLNEIYNQSQKIYSSSDYNQKEVYTFSVSTAGTYEVNISNKSIGFLADGDKRKILMNLDGMQPLQANASNDNSNFGSVNLTKGEHTAILQLPPQKNLLSDPVEKKLVGSTCYVSTLQNYLSGNHYHIHYFVRNNFDRLFFFFVNGKKTYYTSLLTYFNLADMHMEEKDYVISSENVPSDQNAKSIEVYFCSPSLTQQLYTDNVLNLSAVQVINPVISLTSTVNVQNPSVVPVTFKQKNPTDFTVDLGNNMQPYYLIFTQRFSQQWQASSGMHSEGNGYANVWYITDTSLHTLHINYAPQKIFYFAVAISLVTLVIVLILLLRF